MALDFPNSPVNGEVYEGFVYDSTTGVWRVRPDSPNVPIEYLIISGGGSGRGAGGPGGGAGGYLTSTIKLVAGENYTVTVGAGGAYLSSGSISQFGPVVPIPGGHGRLSDGGSGGGERFAFTSTQGNDGGTTSLSGSGNTAGAGGGGAGAAGASAVTAGGNGGNGLASSITGSSVTRGGGGGGGGDDRSPGRNAGSGGTGGGGNGSRSSTGSPGTINTGGGGGGGGVTSGGSGQDGGAGGSGVVIVNVPGSTTLTVGAGLTYSTAAVGSNTVYTFTAGTDTVSF